MTGALDEERDFLLRSLRDLDAERAAGDIDDADYNALRDDYTARAAAVLRELDAVEPAEEPEPSPPEHNRTSTRSVAIVAAMLVVAGLAGWAVARSSGERVAGGTTTGSIEQATTDRITRAEQLVSEGKLLDAVKLYDSLLRDDPQNPVALAERGWLISRVDPTLVDKGLESIDRAIVADPGYAEAHFYRGMILLQSKGDPAGAATEFQRALDANPPADLVSYLRQARDAALAQAKGS